MHKEMAQQQKKCPYAVEFTQSTRDFSKHPNVPKSIMLRRLQDIDKIEKVAH